MFSSKATSLQDKSVHPTVVTGTLSRKFVQGEWAVGTLRTDSGDLRVVGEAVAPLLEGRVYECHGERRHHAKYGDQFAVTSAFPAISVEREALTRYLADAYAGVGPKTAEQIVEWFVQNETLESLRTLLVRTPWRLESHPSTGGSRAIRLLATEQGPAASVANELLTRYSALGVPLPVLRRIAAWLTAPLVERQIDDGDAIDGALQAFIDDPYRPIAFVSGYSFNHAEVVARYLGISPQAPCRVAAVVHQAVNTAVTADGHTYLPLEQLKTALRVQGIKATPQEALQAASAAGYDLVLQSNRVYTADGFRIEQRTATLLADMLGEPSPLVPPEHAGSLASKIAFAAAQNPPPLDKDQQAVILGMLTSPSRLHTLTAGPGCGKTAIMQVMAKLTPAEVRFCAPTGKAAKVLAQRVGPHGFRASTVHSLLEMTPEGFARNSTNPIEADVVVLDEAGMNDQFILCHLLGALRSGAHLILLGDYDQLPSIGAGNTLADILALPADHHRLSRTYRNSGDIQQLVASVRRGVFELPAEPDGTVSHYPLPSQLEQGLAVIEKAYLSAIERIGIQNVILILSRRTGSPTEPNWSTTYMNRRLQARLNPDGDRVPGTILRVGDRILIRRNLSLDDPGGGDPQPVVNGDTGRVLSYSTDGRKLESCALLLDDTRKVTFPALYVEHIDLAYAMTVHAAQGSEYERVLFVATDGSPRFMHRRLFFTAISRPRERLSIYGDLPLIRRVVQRPGPQRYTHLVQATTALLESC